MDKTKAAFEAMADRFAACIAKANLQDDNPAVIELANAMTAAMQEAIETLSEGE